MSVLDKYIAHEEMFNEKDSQIKQLKYLVEFYERELDLKNDELKVANGLLKELERQLSFYADKNQNQ